MKRRRVTKELLARHNGRLICSREGCNHQFSEGEEIFQVQWSNRPIKIFCSGCFFAERQTIVKAGVDS
jgi:hypothetical protein